MSDPPRQAQAPRRVRDPARGNWSGNLCMYETRLRAVLLVLGLGLALLAAGLFQLQIVEGGRYRTEAQHRLFRAPGFYPTVRGGIYDRNGVALARDAGAYDVAIYYPFIEMDEAFTARMAREWGVAPDEARNRVAGMWPAPGGPDRHARGGTPTTRSASSATASRSSRTSWPAITAARCRVGEAGYGEPVGRAPHAGRRRRHRGGRGHQGPARGFPRPEGHRDQQSRVPAGGRRPAPHRPPGRGHPRGTRRHRARGSHQRRPSPGRPQAVPARRPRRPRRHRGRLRGTPPRVARHLPEGHPGRLPGRHPAGGRAGRPPDARHRPAGRRRGLLDRPAGRRRPVARRRRRRRHRLPHRRGPGPGHRPAVRPRDLPGPITRRS